MKKIMAGGLVTCVLLMAGCGKPAVTSPPKCSDAETLSKLISSLTIQIDLSEFDQIPVDSIQVVDTRATAFDENIKKLSCEGTLTMSNQLKLPIRYESQLNDDNKHIVVAKDFDVKLLSSDPSDAGSEEQMSTLENSTDSSTHLSSDQLTATGMVEKLYADFPEDGTESVQILPVPELSKIFTPNLVSLINRDNKCAEEFGGICNLGFSIQWDSQDPTGAKVMVSQGASPEQVRVSIDGDNDPRELLYIMQQTPSGWRVADIQYRDGSSLVEILSRK